MPRIIAMRSSGVIAAAAATSSWLGPAGAAAAAGARGSVPGSTPSTSAAWRIRASRSPRQGASAGVSAASARHIS